MKKIISILTAAVCVAACASFTACGENETPSDVVTETEWIEAFSNENLANVTVERTCSYELNKSTNNGPWSAAYFDSDEYYKTTEKQTLSSTAKLDLEYTAKEYSGATYDIFTGNVSLDSSFTYDREWDYNYTDADVLKEALGEDYYDWDTYAEAYPDDKGSSSDKSSNLDYIKYEFDESYFPYFTNTTYAAEQETVNGVTGEWQYNSDYSSSSPVTMYALGPYYALNNSASYTFYFGSSEIYNLFEYDEEVGAYIYTYKFSTLDEETLHAYQTTQTEGNYNIEETTANTYYVRINDGKLSSIKLVSESKDVYETGLLSGEVRYTYIDCTQSYTYKFYDYGKTTVTIPDDILTEFDKLT